MLSTGLAATSCLTEPALGWHLLARMFASLLGGKLDLDRLQFLVSRSGRKRTLHSQHCSNSSDRLWGAEGNTASRLGSWLSSLRETGGQRPREGVWRPHGWSGAVCL